MDVDDLTVFAYILQTTPAALLAPPEGSSPPTGVPMASSTTRRSRWVRGQAKFTTEDPARYWKDEYFSAVSSIHYFENLMLQYTEDGKGNQMHRGTYEERLPHSAHVAMLLASGSSRADPDALPAPRDDTADGWA